MATKSKTGSKTWSGDTAKWEIQVRYKDGLYYAYAVHTNGKVEREGSYTDKINAILAASDFVHGLRLYHRSADKYKGTDELIGRKIPKKDITDQLKRSKNALAKYMEAHKRIFGE